MINWRRSQYIKLRQPHEVSSAQGRGRRTGIKARRRSLAAASILSRNRRFSSSLLPVPVFFLAAAPAAVDRNASPSLVVSGRPPPRQGFKVRTPRFAEKVRWHANSLLLPVTISAMFSHFLSASVPVFAVGWGQITMSFHTFNLIRDGSRWSLCDCVGRETPKDFTKPQTTRQDHPGQDRSAMSESNPHCSLLPFLSYHLPHLPCSLFFSGSILLLVSMPSPHLVSSLLLIIMDPACNHFAHILKKKILLGID